MLLMDLSISSKRNVSAFQATFFEMLSAWSASFLAGMTRISKEMNHRTCKERRRSLLPMRAAVVAESLFSSCKVYPRQPDHFSIADNPGLIESDLELNFGEPVSWGTLRWPTFTKTVLNGRGPYEQI